jgi:hypothetical protein
MPQDDLLVYAVQHTFRASEAVQRIRAADSPLLPYISKSLQSAGFQLQEFTEKVGLLRWTLGVRVLERTNWRQE